MPRCPRTGRPVRNTAGHGQRGRDVPPSYHSSRNGSAGSAATQQEPHVRITAWFHEALHFARGYDRTRFEVRSQSSFAATEDSVPEPDLQVVRRAMRERLPREALLLIEVANSSLVKDRTIKNEIYAESGVPEYWIVDVKHHTVEVLTRPSAKGYQTLRAGDVLRPLKLRGVELAASDIPWSPKKPRKKRR